MSNLTDAMVHLVLKKESAFLASIMYQVEWEYSNETSTAGINKTNCIVNEAWFNNLTKEQRVGLIAHEVMHLALSHQARRGERDPKMWNQAADYLINYLLIQQGFILPPDGLYNKTLNDKYTTEEIYDILIKDPDNEGDNPYPDLSDKKMSKEEATKLEAELAQITINASTQATLNKQAGTIPNEVTVLLQKYLYPAISWETILYQYFTEIGKDDYSMQKRNRRYRHVFVPAMYSETMGKVNTYLDTSCSVTDEQFAKQHNVMTQIKSTVNPSEMSIIEFDTTIKKIRTFGSEETINNLVFTGRGGTDLTEVSKHILKSRPEVSIIFTDGYVDLKPIESLKTNIIWCIVDNSNFKSKIGKIIHLN